MAVPSRPTVIPTPPSLVNLTALPSEVDHNLPQLAEVALDPGRELARRLGVEGEALLGAAEGEHLAQVLDEAGEVEGDDVGLDLPRLDLGDVENVVDEGEEVLARARDRLDLLELAWAQCPVAARSWVKPRTAFSGVRSSWLMLARNSLFIRFAFSAASLAFRRLSSISIWWRTSRSMTV